MRFLTISILSLSFVACSVKTIPLKGVYPAPPITYVSDKSIDTVWSNLIDYISQKGIAIKIIDKSSGLLVTEDYNFKGLVAYEKKGAILSKPEAYVVTSLQKANNILSAPNLILANWNVRIKGQGKGTLVTVNITNIRNYDADGHLYTYDVRTTGVFEKMIFEHIK